jgi:hypothetical protein
MTAAGVPAHWAVYFGTRNVEATVARVKEANGRVVSEPHDLNRDARVAAVSDATGAFFGLWQPKEREMFQVMGVPGSFAWAELYTHDLEKARTFYAKVFGWQTEAMPHARYPMLMVTERKHQMATMMQIQKEWGVLPPQWQIYFAVSRCDEAVDRATRKGAVVIVPAMTVAGAGKFATLMDPYGASFAVLEPATMIC